MTSEEPTSETGGITGAVFSFICALAPAGHRCKEYLIKKRYFISSCKEYIIEKEKARC